MRFCDRWEVLAAFIIAVSLVTTAYSQTKKTTRPVTVVQPSPEAAKATPTPAEGTKKNGRPGTSSDAAKPSANDYVPTYFYQFDRPGFIVSHIVIEHDAGGKGKITFQKKDLDDMMTDPIQLTSVTVAAIDGALARLDFLNSKTEYQYEADRSNMGNITFRYVHAGSERTVKFNWTTNLDAKVLMDEYRRIGNEAVWKFEFAAARINQPLESPRLVSALDEYIQRDEISDPPHLLPLLKEIAQDERLPLIARNHATRIATSIEKKRK